ncbi:MAG: glycerol-3-phosphate acyltransferase, partial [Salana multivorans]|nr:glycerol-3-phosphate acyltransferase [Salana multivorans]
MRAVVIGSGAWGTTFAQVLADAGNDVVVWTTQEAVAEEINTRHTNGRHLPDGTVLPETLAASTDLARLLPTAEVVVVAL